MKGIKFFYITCSKKKEAYKIAEFLVKKKLVACANIIHNVKKLHSYEVPCVIFFDIKNGNTDFLKWIIKSV